MTADLTAGSAHVSVVRVLASTRRTLRPGELPLQPVALLSFLALGLGTLLTALPASAVAWAGTEVVLFPQRGPVLLAASALVLVGMGTRLLAGAVPPEARLRGRALTLLLGLMSMVFVGDQLRSWMEQAVSRHLWRPAAAFSDPHRLLPTFWVLAAGVVLLRCFWAGLRAALLSIVPEADSARRRATVQASCTPLWTAALLMVGAWAMTPDLVTALGGRVGPERALNGGQVRDLFFGGFYRLETMAALLFLLGVWGAVQVGQLLAENVTLLKPRISDRAMRVATVVMTIGIATTIPFSTHLHVLPRRNKNGDTLFSLLDVVFGRQPAQNFLVLTVAAVVGATALLAMTLEVGDRMAEEKLPAEFATVVRAGPMLLVLLVLISLTFARAILNALLGPVRFAWEWHSFYDFHFGFHVAPHYSSIDIFHVVVPGLVGLAVLAGFAAFADAFLGLLGAAFMLSLALLAPQLADPGALGLVVVVFVVVTYLGTRNLDKSSTTASTVATFGVALMGCLLLVYRIPFHLPLWALLIATALLRFGWQAHDLTPEGGVTEHRVRGSLALPLLLTGLAIADQIVPGGLGIGLFSTIGQQFALPLLGLPFVAGLLLDSFTTRKNAAGSAT